MQNICTSADDLNDQAVNDRVCDCDSGNLTHEDAASRSFVGTSWTTFCFALWEVANEHGWRCDVSVMDMSTHIAIATLTLKTEKFPMLPVVGNVDRLTDWKNEILF